MTFKCHPDFFYLKQLFAASGKTTRYKCKLYKNNLIYPATSSILYIKVAVVYLEYIA